MNESTKKRKFKPGDRATNGIVNKTILYVQEQHQHYLTEVGVIPFEDEDKWKLTTDENSCV